MVVGEKLMICRLTIQPRVVTAVHTHEHEQMTMVERGRVLLHHRRRRARLLGQATCCTFLRIFRTARRCWTRKWCWSTSSRRAREDFLPNVVRWTADVNSLFDLTGKIALVTGASRGLGAAMALALADAGADVAVHASTKPPSATEAAIKAKGRQAQSLRGEPRESRRDRASRSRGDRGVRADRYSREQRGQRCSGRPRRSIPTRCGTK